MEEVVETWVCRRFCRVSAALCHQVQCLFRTISVIACLNFFFAYEQDDEIEYHCRTDDSSTDALLGLY